MKKRLPSLDGLRGFAALAVLFSHSGFSIDSIVHGSFFTFVYKTFAVGPNSVQILFVLSGFLMAYLYPHITSPIRFIKKRYARIIPVYVLAVFFISEFGLKNLRWEQEMMALIVMAIVTYVVWNIFERNNLASFFGKLLFSFYVGLQLGMLLINLFITPHFIQYGVIHLPGFYTHILILLSNITLTTPFVSGVPRLSGVFWSLAPEIYFYLIYPFFIIPLIHTGKKWGTLASIIISLSVIKILFDLDGAFVGLGSLLSLSIARSCGFLAGVIAGSVYESQGTLWEKIERIGKNPLVQIFVLLSFFTIQWGDWAVRDGQSIYFMNAYYLLSSFVISFLIIASVIPNSLTNKVFSSRLLVFFGMLSYSIYLIHPQTIDWVNLATPPILQSIHILFPLFLISLTTGVSYVLFLCVESLYFRNRKNSKVQVEKKKIKQDVDCTYSPKIISLLLAIALLFFIGVYSGGYSPSFLLSRHLIPSSSFLSFEKPLLEGKMKIPLDSSFDNLSAIVLDLRYFQNADVTRNKKGAHSVLIFRLLDAHTGKKIFESERNSFDVEGSPRYPFGITTINDSKGKKYIVELELKNGKKYDQVFVNTSPTSLVSIYTTSKKTLLKNPLIFVMNRLLFAFSHQGMLFAALFAIVLSFFYRKEK